MNKNNHTLENKFSFNKNHQDQLVNNNDLISENSSDQQYNVTTEENKQIKFKTNLQNRNIETIQCKLKLNDKMIESDI